MLIAQEDHKQGLSSVIQQFWNKWKKLQMVNHQVSVEVDQGKNNL
jgi:hypothetical protein